MFTFQVIQDEITAAIQRILAGTDDLTPVMESIGGVLANRVKLTMGAGEDPYGNPWPALKFRSGQPLRDTGRLINSITHNVPAPNAVEVGTNVAYAPVHQFGAVVEAPAAKGNVSIDGYTAKGAPALVFTVDGRVYRAKRVEIPARPMFPTEQGGLPESWSGDILDVLNGYFLSLAA